MRRCFLLSCLLVGCTAATADVTDANTDDDWWNTVTSDTDDGDEEYDEEEEYDEDEGPFQEQLYWAEFFFEGGEIEGAYGYLSLDTELFEDPLCEIEYPMATITPTDGCDACEAAWEIALEDESEVYAELGDTCSEDGATGLEGTTLHLGYADETMYRRVDGTWEAVGWAYREGPVLFMEEFLGED